MDSNGGADYDLDFLMVAPHPYYEPRGVLISIFTRALALKEFDCRTHLVTYPIGEDRVVENMRISRIPNLIGVKNVPVGASVRKILLDVIMWFYLLFHLFRNANEYDALYCHEEAAVFCVPLSRMFGIPLVYEYHSKLSDIAEDQTPFGYEPFLSLLDSLQVWALTKADFVLFLTEKFRRDFQEHVPHDRVFSIRNLPAEALIDEEELQDPPSELIEAGSRAQFRLLYAGSFEEYQQLDELIEGFSRATNRENLHVTLVGGKQPRLGKIRELVAEKDLEDLVTVHGKLPLEQIPSLLEDADVLLCSRGPTENVPLKALSYLWAGKPIMATNIEAHREYLDEDEALWVNPHREGFREGFESLPDRNLEELARRAQRKYEARYSLDRFIEKHGPFLKALERYSQ